MIAALISSAKREELRLLGRGRTSGKDASWSRRRSGIFTDEELDELGMYGEWAVAHYLGLNVNEDVTIGGDGGVDLLWCGHGVSVKCNHKWRGYLMIERRDGDDVVGGIVKELTTELVVLVHGLCRPPLECLCRGRGSMWVVLAGWLWRDEFFVRMVERDWGYGGRYVVGADHLRPMHEIWSLSG